MSNIEKLSSSSSLKDLVDRQELLTNNIEEQKNTLKEILISKNVVVSEGENKLSILIDKVNELVNGMLWLYKEGNECPSVTGGFLEAYSSDWSNSPIFSKYSTYMQSSFTATSGGVYSNIGTYNKINLSGFSKICIESELITLDTSSSTRVFKLEISNDKNNTSRVAHLEMNSTLNKGRVISKLDISSLNTQYYISVVLGQYLANLKANAKIYNIWLEK